MTDLAGTYTIREEWDLFVDGELQSVYVEEVEVEPAGPGEYRVKAYEPQGPSQRLVSTETVDRESLVSTLRSSGHDVPAHEFDFGGGL